MTINEMNLDDRDAKKLTELLEIHNRSASQNEQKTLQEYAEELLKGAIYHKWKLMRSI